MRYGTLRIEIGDIVKRISGVGVSEGVKQGHAPVEPLLNGGFAGDRERDCSQFFRCGVVVCLLCDGEGWDEE
jgi:hypothetical protein